MEVYYETNKGKMVRGDCLEVLQEHVEPKSVNLIMTSPPFGLVRKKAYGNVDADEYVAWFKPFGEAFKRILREDGSLVIDIGGAWIKGQPTRSLYHFKLLIMLCEEVGFHLAQEFYWWNPSKLPTPAEWVTVRRIRVKDAVNCVWWLSRTPYPKASNRRVLQPYSDSMEELLAKGYRAKIRPSGHNISKKFRIRNRGAIPPNLIALANTESNSWYLTYCKEHGIDPHPARYPSHLPEYFIRMLTDVDDLVIDPFGGSCVTGKVAENLSRRWICIDTEEEYLKGALGRFSLQNGSNGTGHSAKSEDGYYSIPRPGLLWGDSDKEETLLADGGRTRPATRKREQEAGSGSDGATDSDRETAYDMPLLEPLGWVGEASSAEEMREEAETCESGK